MRVHWWSSDNHRHEHNLGDWLSVPILRAMGHEPESPSPGEPCLFACGSIAHQTHAVASGASRIVVWGSGVQDGATVDPITIPVRYAAVRGPITRDALGLPTDIPLGDPAMLLPGLIPLPSPPAQNELLYVGHCGSPHRCPPGFDTGVTMLVAEPDALPLVARIAAAKFVASESLHGCILAHAYGVPWAMASADPWPITPKSKYNGFLASVGLPPIPGFLPADIDACRDWFDSVGRHAQTPDLAAMVAAFPHEL